MKRLNFVVYSVIVLVAALALVVTGCTPTATPSSQVTQTPTAASTAKLPSIIGITSYGPGTSMYIKASAAREVIEKLSSMKVRVEPYETATERVLPVRHGDSILGMAMGTDSVPAAQGWLEFSTPDWGPQPYQVVWLGDSVGYGPMVWGDSDIRRLEDLKGKTLTYTTGLQSSQMLIKGILAYLGWTWDDIKTRGYASTTLAFRGTLEGTADCSIGVVNSSVVYEIEASRHGVRFLSIPHANLEGWKRLQETAPWVFPYVGTSGPKWVVENKPEISGMFYAFYTYANTDENTIYEIVKALDTGYDLLKGMHPDLVQWTLKNALNVSVLPIAQPYHPGAVRYFKEKGVWTAELEQWETKQLNDWKKMRATFEADPKAWYEKNGPEGILKFK